MLHPDFCYVEFRVKTEDDHLGSYVVALDMMRTGYRNVYLESYSGARLTPAALFVHVELRDESPNVSTEEEDAGCQ